MEKKTENEISEVLTAGDGADRREIDRLPEPPYEKTLSELAGTDASSGDGAIRVYRYTNQSTGMELQIRSSFQMVFVLRGSCTLNIRGEETALPEGGLLVIAKGIPHLIGIPDDAQVVGVMLPVSVLKSQFCKIVELRSPISAFFSNSLWGDVVNPYMIFHRTGSVYTRTLVDMLVSEECFPTANSAQMKIFILMTLIGCLSSYTPAEYEMSPMRIVHSEQIPRILNYISDNYRTVTLESLAKHFHYTVPYVSKLIRSATGMTFTAILRETKLDVCRSMLLNSDLKIYQIAEIAGFQNTDHFNRTFKKRTGLTPSDFKKSRLDNRE